MSFLNESTDQADEYEPCKMFVGGLSWATTPDTMKAYFLRFGNVSDCVVMSDPATGKPRGFGFVTFTDPQSVTNALESGPHRLDDKTIDPKRANSKSHTSQPTSKKVFVGGLSFDSDEDTIKAAVQSCGFNTTQVDIKKDGSGKKRGFAFVDLATTEEADNLCKLKYITVDKKKVEVKKAEPKSVREKSQRDGGQMQMSFPGGPQVVPHQFGQSQHHHPAAAAMNYGYTGSDLGSRYNGLSNAQYGTSGAHYSFAYNNPAYTDYPSGYNQPGNTTVYPPSQYSGYQNYRGGATQQQMSNYSQDSSSYNQSRNGFPTSGGNSGYGGFEQGYSNYGDQQHSGSNQIYSGRSTSSSNGGQSRGSSSNYQSYSNH